MPVREEVILPLPHSDTDHDRWLGSAVIIATPGQRVNGALTNSHIHPLPTSAVDSQTRPYYTPRAPSASPEIPSCGARMHGWPEYLPAGFCAPGGAFAATQTLEELPDEKKRVRVGGGLGDGRGAGGLCTTYPHGSCPPALSDLHYGPADGCARRDAHRRPLVDAHSEGKALTHCRSVPCASNHARRGGGI